MKKLPSIAAAVVWLSACTIRPLYDTRRPDNVIAQMETIAIPPITGEDGVWGIRMRNRLLDRLTPRGRPEHPHYTLAIHLYPSRRLDYTMDRFGVATSYALRANARYELFNRHTGNRVLRGVVSSSSSYPILRDQYSSEVLRANAQTLIIEDLADQIYLVIVSWLVSEGQR